MPAFVAMVTMPYTFSIGYGIIAGLLLWTLGLSLATFSWKIRSCTHTSDMETHHLWAVS